MHLSFMVIVILLCTSCASYRIEKEHHEWLETFGSRTPPGTMALNDSVYIDRRETVNLGWLEYEYWVEHVFGPKSVEHLSTLPDTAAWYGQVPHDTTKVFYYLRHPAYAHYPVVGVTHAQALAFCQWRSDRVMEMSLVMAGIIPWRFDQKADDHFSIERFYATDSLKAFHPLPYPSYDLPTLEEWQLALALSDSLARTNLKRCRQRDRDDHPGGVKDDRFIIVSRENSQTDTDPIAKDEALDCKQKLIWNIRGNVAELCKDSTLVLGGGWTDPLDSMLLDQPFPSHAPNASTGLRCVCQWRKWNGVRQ